jgi:hypothetical protein
MARIIDDFGYRTKIPEEEYIAITLVDNGIDPYKKMKKKSLHNKVIQEYKRKKKYTSKSKKSGLSYQLNKINWKKLDNLYKQILQDGRTKKNIIPKSRKTRKRSSK